MKRLLLFTLVWPLPLGYAGSNFTMSVDLLDPSDGNQLPPPGVVCVDLFFDVVPDDRWNATGIRGTALEGARLVYADDPNSNQPRLANPGTNNRFVTFLSEPLPPLGNARYRASRAYHLGDYCPTGPNPPQADPNVFNIAYTNPPPNPGDGVDGWIFRVALDITGTWFEDQQMYPLALFMGTPEGGTHVPVFFSDCTDEGISEFGTVSATYDQPFISGFDWWIGAPVPEPATAVLLMPAAVLLSRRRK